MDFGDLSILFSYGEAFGFAYNELVIIRADASQTTRRHLNKWRDFRLQKELPTQRFHAALLTTLSLAVGKLLTTFDPNQTGITTMLDVSRGTSMEIEAEPGVGEEVVTEEDDYLDEDLDEDDIEDSNDDDEDEWDDDDDIDDDEFNDEEEDKE